MILSSPGPINQAVSFPPKKYNIYKAKKKTFTGLCLSLPSEVFSPAIFQIKLYLKVSLRVLFVICYLSRALPILYFPEKLYLKVSQRSLYVIIYPLRSLSQLDFRVILY